MKRFSTVVPLILLIAGCAESPPPADDPTGGTAMASGPVIIAHRGFSARAPEHTLAAWDLAVEAGADYLEQDLQMTSDGVLVVLHDPTLDRTARGPAADCAGPVIEKPLERLRLCDVGSWFNESRPDRADPAFPSLRIPTLEEVFARYGNSVRYYIETKNPEEAPGMEAELVRLLDRHGLLLSGGEPPRVLVQSFSPESLIELHRLAPSLPLVQLFSRIPSSGVRDSLPAVAAYAAGIGPHFSSVDADLVRAAHELGLVLHPYTVNDPVEMRRLQALGIDGFFTDDPTLARATLGS